MTTIIGGFIVLAALVFIYYVIIRAPFFSAKRARIEVRSLTGGNAAMWLAVIGIASLVMSIAGDLNDLGALTSQHGPLLAALAVALLLVLVIGRSADLLLGLLGAAASIASVFIQNGSATGVLFVVMCLVLLTLMSLLRGLFGR